MDRESVSSLHGLVEQIISHHWDKIAVLYDTGELREYVTYRQMWDTSSLVMEALARYSVQNEVVGLCLEQDKYIPSIILGILRSEAAFYNFEPGSIDFVSQVIQEICIRVLIVDVKFLRVFQSLIFKCNGHLISFAIPECPHIILIDLQGIHRKCHHGNLAYCITTSGTTGKPKVVQVPHCCIVPNIVHIRNIYELTSDDLVLLCSPLTFDPCIVELFTSLSVGACVLVVPNTVKVLPEMLLDVIFYRNKVTVIQCTPTLIRRFDPVKVRETILGPVSALRVLSLGGEKFPSCSEIQELKTSGNQTKFFNLYGITEVSSWATCYQVTDFTVEREVHLGCPLLDTEVKICDTFGETVLEGTGRIFIGGQKRQCIIGLEEEQSYDIKKTRWRDTGDFGRITKDGCIYYIGREDSQVKRLGKRLNMEELNQVAKEVPSIRCCTAQLIDSKLVLFIVINPLEEGSSNIAKENSNTHKIIGMIDKFQRIKETVIDKIKTHLPSHYIPDTVLEIDNLPVTKHGKVDVKELSSIYSKRQIFHNNSPKPSDCLTRAWTNILCISGDTISDNSSFVQTGGDSFKALQLVDKLETDLNCKLPKLFDLILNQTFKSISDYLETVTEEETKPSNLEKTAGEMVKSSNNLLTTNHDTFALDREDTFDELRTPNPSVAGADRVASNLNTCIVHTEASEEITVQQFLTADKSSVEGIMKNSDISMTKDTDSDNFNTQTFDDVSEWINQDDNNAMDKSVLTAVQASWHTSGSYMQDDMVKASHKRSFDFDDSDLENKKVKFQKKRRKFCKFIQRGNKICNLCSSKDDHSVTDYIPNKLMISKPSQAIDFESKGVSDCIKMNDQLKVNLKERWRYNTGKCVDASPLLAISRDTDDSVVFIGSHSHKFSAISIATGNQLWEITLEDRVESSACLSQCGHYVIFGCYDGCVYFIDSDTGDIFWWFQTGSQVKSSPTVDMATGLIYIGSHSQCVYAFNIQNRKCAWKVDLHCGSIFSSPVISDDPHQVYVGTLGGWMVALSPLTGVEMWRCNLGKPVFSSPAISRHGVVVGCVDNSLYLFSHSGELVWRFKSQGPIFSSPAVWRKTNKPRDSDWTELNEVSVISAANKTVNHNYSLLSSSDMISRDNDLHKIMNLQTNASSETKETSLESDLIVRNTLNSLDNFCEETIIFGSHDACVYCLTGSGQLIWKNQTESPVYSTPYIGTVHVKYLVSDDISGDDAVNDHGNPLLIHKVKEQIDDSEELEAIKEQSEFSGSEEEETNQESRVNSVSDKICVNDDKETVNKGSDKADNTCNHRRKPLGSVEGKHLISDAKRLFSNKEELEYIDIVAFASTKGTLYIVRVKDGQTLCKLRMVGEVFSSPLLYNNSVIIGCRDDNVYCFDIESSYE